MADLIDPAFERWLVENKPHIHELVDAAGAIYRKELKSKEGIGSFPWRKPVMKLSTNHINESDGNGSEQAQLPAEDMAQI